MVLKPEVINAFKILELDPASTTKEQATTVYKKLALKHHPDRNYGDSSANERFQQIGAAWSICQRHFEYPASSLVPEPGARGGFENFASGRTYSAEDEVPLDDFEASEFFRFMFEEVFMGRYSHSKGRRYRSQRAGAAGGGVFTFSGGFAEAQQRQAENAARQAKEHEEYKQRVRDFEREQAKEQAEINRLAREEARDQARLASAQNNAFQLAKEGQNAELRALIEKFDLDVTKPRKLNQKKAETNFETLLHVAAGSCDVALLDWLLGRGANPSALDPSKFTPFHVAILRGNTSVARHLISLYRNTKSTDPRHQSFCDGCHPSKAAKDKNGSTPLELAIKSGSIDMVELLLKDATVHNVQRSWSQLEQGGTNKQIADMLLTKNGFKPPEQNGVETQHQSMSKKAVRKLKQAEEEKRAKEERERRLAEEEENRLKKQARREKAVKDEAERQAMREAEERKRIKEAEEEERRRQAKQQEQAHRDAKERALREVEEQARREAEARKQREEERRQEAAREAKRKSREKEAAMQKAKEEALARQLEIEAASARQEKAEAARFAQREAELQHEHELCAKAEEQRAKQKQEEQLQRETARLMVEAKARLQQEQEHVRRIQEDEAVRASQDAIMRRRAEQSARDKARNQRIREEKAKLQTLESVVAPLTPWTPSPKKSMLPMQDQGIPTVTKHKRSKRASSSAVSPSEPPPVPLHTRPKIESTYSHHPPTLLSPPMTPEDLQTIPIPEDLFPYEPPVAVIKDPVPSSPASPVPSLRAQGQVVGQRGRRQSVVQDASRHASLSETEESGHISNGIPCRFFNKRGGCARGLQCAFLHVATPRIRRTALEEELAKKNLEIERMRAELAAANARAS